MPEGITERFGAREELALEESRESHSYIRRRLAVLTSTRQPFGVEGPSLTVCVCSDRACHLEECHRIPVFSRVPTKSQLIPLTSLLDISLVLRSVALLLCQTGS